MPSATTAPARSKAAAYSELNLAGDYALSSPTKKIKVRIALPGDVHTALLKAKEIPDPYFGANEQEVMWVNETAWAVERKFAATAADIDGYLTLTLENVDTFATILVNGKEVARTQNMFVRYDIDVTGKVKAGENTLRIEFDIARDIAWERSKAHPFEIPFTNNYKSNGLPGIPMNFIRKVACHAGWDWGICLMPIGVYGRMSIRRSRLARQESVQVDQKHFKDRVELTLKTRLFAFADGEVELRHKLDAGTVGGKLRVTKGENVVTHKLTVANPKLWWPNGQGAQPLYTLTTTLDGETTTRRVGLRKLEWVIEKDAIDHTFKCRINGRDITMMGANWIPADAIPSRITEKVVRDLLESAKAVNMNMLRVWGGGQYEPDYFYELCDELGILVWHDFMFSCMLYPAGREFLDDVATEITQQVRRLSHHASLALWCGDNEVIGAIGWHEETRNNRERYVALYTKLNSMLQRIVEDEDPARRFWPSSPSLGYMDFSDGWHSDTRGDTHFWQVWHEAAPFERAREVNPRFASEFGFQSFTSTNIIESFTRPEDRNPSSPVMESHQRNPGGNARILETMTRYFRFPSNFDNMVFLSQIQQGLAIKTAIEYWRSTKPRCMGTLYWQINDTYPVHSWASLDYGGQWKLLHYMAKRFFLPINVVAVPEGERIEIKAINDSAERATIGLTVRAVNVAGGDRVLLNTDVKTSPDKAVVAARIALGALKPGEFLLFSWTDAAGKQLGENDFFPQAYKYYEPAHAKIRAAWSGTDEKPVLTLTTDKPALFVTATVDAPGYFSDNALTLIPGRPAKLTFTPRNGKRPSRDALAKSLKVRHLRETY
jgi:beta-mannosidase